jgi:hypothetical protein
MISGNVEPHCFVVTSPGNTVGHVFFPNGEQYTLKTLMMGRLSTAERCVGTLAADEVTREHPEIRLA